MGYKELVELMKRPDKQYLLNMGAGKLSKRFKVSREDVFRARNEVRKLISPPINAHQERLPKILVFDIETSPTIAVTFSRFKANIGLDNVIQDPIMLTFSAKWLFSPDVIYDAITPEEVKNFDDRRIVTNLWKLLDQSDMNIAHYGCVTPGHRILKSDLTWEYVENLKVGDELLAFDEHSHSRSDAKNPRKYKLSKVVHSEPIIKRCSEILLSDGTKIIASDDHPWLTKHSKKHAHWVYTNTDTLLRDNIKGAKKFKTRDTLSRVLIPWESNIDNYHSGYLAGFFDADGCLRQQSRKGRKYGYTFTVTFSQKDDSIIDKLCESLNFFKFKYSIRHYDPFNKTIKIIRLLGGMPESLRFLAITNAYKKNKLKLDKLCELRLSATQDYEIISVTPIGDREVIGLETTSKTYIVEGFPCHNSGFDIPFLNSRAIIHDLPPYSPTRTIDTKRVASSQFRFPSNKLDALGEYFKVGKKIKTDINLWMNCIRGDQEALDNMSAYNNQDVILLEEVYLKLRPWIKSHPNLGMYMNLDETVCSCCGSTKIYEVPDRFFFTQTTKYPVYRCFDCGGQTRGRKTILDKTVKTTLGTSIPK